MKGNFELDKNPYSPVSTETSLIDSSRKVTQPVHSLKLPMFLLNVLITMAGVPAALFSLTSLSAPNYQDSRAMTLLFVTTFVFVPIIGAMSILGMSFSRRYSVYWMFVPAIYLIFAIGVLQIGIYSERR
jgi:hypothetical protein